MRNRVVQNQTKPQQGVILAIEDNPEDVELLRVALAQRNCPWIVVSVPFARDAMMYLGRQGHYTDPGQFPKPNLIVLDLSLPGMSGMEFLSWARHEPDVPPIVVLTYSKLEENRILAEKLGAKGYFTKSLDLKETAAMIETLLMLSTPPQIPPGQNSPQNLQ